MAQKSLDVPIRVARSGQESMAQGLPWEMPPPKLALKGPLGSARIGSESLNWIACAVLAPSGRNVLCRLTQGKPWAKLSCPCGAGASGRMTAAKHILHPGRQWSMPHFMNVL